MAGADIDRIADSKIVECWSHVDVGGGTDVALETADAAILHSRVMDVANLVSLSRSVMANIRQNIAVALGLKAVFLVTTVAGFTGLWPAILADRRGDSARHSQRDATT